MHLAKNLRFLRLKNGFSQEYIAEKLGYKSYTTIQKWEMGTSEPSISTLNKLSEIYNTNIWNKQYIKQFGTFLIKYSET